MATTRRSKRVLCPMYVGDAPIEISCEGPFDSCPRVTLSFKNRNACEQHMTLFCDKAYCCCEVYRMIMAAKYDDAAPPHDGSRYVSTFADRRGPRSHERKGSLSGLKGTRRDATTPEETKGDIKGRNMTEKLVISIDELAKTMGIGSNKAHELVKQPGFPSVRHGKRILIPVELLKKWLARQVEHREEE